MGWLTVLRQVGEKFAKEKKIFEEKSACLDSPTLWDRNLLAELILHWVAGFSHLRLAAVIYQKLLEITTGGQGAWCWQPSSECLVTRL